MRKGLFVIVLLLVGLLVSSLIWAIIIFSDYGTRTVALPSDPSDCYSGVEVEVVSACIHEDTINITVHNKGIKDFPRIGLIVISSRSNTGFRAFSFKGMKSSEIKTFSNISWPGEINNVKQVKITPGILSSDKEPMSFICSDSASYFPSKDFPSESLPNC